MLTPIGSWLARGIFDLLISGGAVWVALQFFGGKLFDHLLQTRTEEFRARTQREIEGIRSDAAQELERLRAQIAVTLSRASHIHDKEIVVYSEAWRLFEEALMSMQFATRTLVQYPDVDHMNEDALIELLEGSGFSRAQREHILAASNKGATYRRLAQTHEVADARKRLSDFAAYVRSHSIFMPEQLRNAFLDAVHFTHGVLVDLEIGREANDHRMVMEGMEKALSGAPEHQDRIAALIQQRIKYYETP